MLKIWDDESYGMERNMNRITSEVMRNSRPIKMDENMKISYRRDGQIF